MKFYHHINYRDRLFHHAWWWNSFKLSIASGKALRFEFTRGDSDDNGLLSLGLGFFSVWLTFPLPERFLLKRKCIATWDGGREFYLTDGRRYGFYFYEWAFVWSWHAKVDESSARDPWWMRQYIHIDDLFLGRSHCLTRDVLKVEGVWFKLGGKEFKMDSIAWEENKRFRAHIPFSLWHQKYYRAEIKIENPPLYSGKGENSWDCGDDGSYGLSWYWEGPSPRWDNKAEIIPIAVEKYVKNVLHSAKKYGGSSSAQGIRAFDVYEYIGVKP